MLSWPRTVGDGTLDRAAGCLFGQVIGDNLGALVEFKTEQEIAHHYPNGVRDLHDGGQWNILEGQATDDSELALALARTLLKTRRHDREAIAAAYGDWYDSGPFDMGATIGRALSAAASADAERKAPAASSGANETSQANGSLMRVSPIGIWARQPEVADRFAREDSGLTHPNEVCVDACGVFAAAIAEGIRSGMRDAMLRVALAHALTDAVKDALRRAANGEAPQGYSGGKSGWVLIALQKRLLSPATGRNDRGRAGRDRGKRRRYRHQRLHRRRAAGRAPMGWAQSPADGSCQSRPAGPTALSVP